MFERFTDRARRAMVRAQKNAPLLEHNFIGTEHLLLGPMDDCDADGAGAGAGAEALERSGSGRLGSGTLG